MGNKTPGYAIHIQLLITFSAGSSFRLIRIVKGGNSDDEVDQNTKGAFQVIGFPVAEKIANHENGQDQEDNFEEMKIQILRSSAINIYGTSIF